MPQTTLGQIIFQLEGGAGGAPQGPGSVSRASGVETFANEAYGQHAGFADQYGSGEAGVLNYANQMVAANPNVTVGEFYASYNQATGNPANVTSLGTLAANNPGAYRNFTSNAGSYANTPLSATLGGSQTAAAPNSGASPSEAFDPNSGMFDNNSQVGTQPTANSLMSDQQSAGFMMGANAATPQMSGDNVAISATQAPVQDDITRFQVAGVNAPADSAVSTGAAPSGTAPQGSTAVGGGGIAIDVTNVAAAGQTAANTLSSGITTGSNTLAKSVAGAGQAVQSSEGNLAAAGTSWLGSLFGALTSLLVRGGFIAVGLVILLGALMLFYGEQKQGGSEAAA